MTQLGVPIPGQDKVVKLRNWAKYPNPRDKDPNEGMMEDSWIKYLQDQNDSLITAPLRNASVSLTGQTATIGTTAIPTVSLNGGLYRMTYYFRIETPGTVSSSLQVIFSWTDGGVACSRTSTAVTGNTTATIDSNTLMVYSDPNAPISYATTYASVGATAMAHSLYITLERVDA